MSEFKDDPKIPIRTRTLIEVITTLAYHRGLEDRVSDGNVVQMRRYSPWPLEHAIDLLKREMGGKTDEGISNCETHTFQDL